MGDLQRNADPLFYDPIQMKERDGGQGEPIRSEWICYTPWLKDREWKSTLPLCKPFGLEMRVSPIGESLELIQELK